MGFSRHGTYKSQVFHCKTLLAVYLILRVLPKHVQLAELTASKVQPWLPSLQIQILSSLRVLTAGGRSRGGCLGCTSVSWSSAAASCLLLRGEDLGWGQRGCRRAACGSAGTRLPCAFLRLATCCRNDCGHGLRCSLWSSSGIGTLAGNGFLFVLLKRFPDAQPSSLSFVLALGLGTRFGSQFISWVWINWACPSCWSPANFCYQLFGKKGLPVTCTADILGLISEGGQSDTQRFVGIESQQQVLHPKLLLGQREGREQLSNVRCSVLPGTWNTVILGLKSELAMNLYETALVQNWTLRNSELLWIFIT